MTVSPHQPALLASLDPQVEVARKLVFDFWREMIEGPRMIFPGGTNMARSDRATNLAVILAAATVLLASGSSMAATAHPDFTGLWQLPEDAVRTFDSTVAQTDDERPPYNAEWMETWRTIRERSRRGMKVWDPATRCLPPGMPRTMNVFYPMEILDTPGRLTILTEFFNETRRIWTDGRGHPAPDDLEPTFSGHSIGRWEGETLVIDTIGLRPETVIDVSRIPHSDQLHIVERVRRTGPNSLEWSMTLNDPVVFDRPWSTVKKYTRSPPGTEVREFVCAENTSQDKYEPSPDEAKYDRYDPRLKTLP